MRTRSSVGEIDPLSRCRRSERIKSRASRKAALEREKTVGVPHGRQTRSAKNLSNVIPVKEQGREKALLKNSTASTSLGQPASKKNAPVIPPFDLASISLFTVTLPVFGSSHVLGYCLDPPTPHENLLTSLSLRRAPAKPVPIESKRQCLPKQQKKPVEVPKEAPKYPVPVVENNPAPPNTEQKTQNSNGCFMEMHEVIAKYEEKLRLFLARRQSCR